MTFEEWQATRKQVADLRDTVGGDEDGAPLAGYEYECGWIADMLGHPEMVGPRYWFIVERDEYQFDTLAEAETALWEKWSRDEINGGAQ